MGFDVLTTNTSPLDPARGHHKNLSFTNAWVCFRCNQQLLSHENYRVKSSHVKLFVT